MGKLEIVLKGRIPSKKNSKQWVGNGNRKFLIPSKNYAIWHEEQMWELKKYKVKSPITRCSMIVEIAFPDNRRADISNKYVRACKMVPLSLPDLNTIIALQWPNRKFLINL